MADTATKLTTTGSDRAFARAQAVLPGGVNSPVRAFKGVGGTPRFMTRGEGPYVYDVDGNRYIDCVGAYGPMVLGHAHPTVTKAITEQAGRGWAFGAPTDPESDLAEAIIAAVPTIEMVRLVNSGTEACMSALRLARGGACGAPGAGRGWCQSCPHPWRWRWSGPPTGSPD